MLWIWTGLTLSKFKAFLSENLKILLQCVPKCLEEDRKHCGKRRTAGDQNFLLFPKGFFLRVINPFPNKPLFLGVFRTCLLKTLWAKREITHNKQFLLFLHCFLPFWRIFCHFHWIWNCHLQTLLIWKSLKFVIWEIFETRLFNKGSKGYDWNQQSLMFSTLTYKQRSSKWGLNPLPHNDTFWRTKDIIAVENIERKHW